MKTKQVGGNHYQRFVIQPIEFILKNGLNFLEGSVIKYTLRAPFKNGVEDYRKAIHCLEMLIEEYERQSREAANPS